MNIADLGAAVADGSERQFGEARMAEGDGDEVPQPQARRGGVAGSRRVVGRAQRLHRNRKGDAHHAHDHGRGLPAQRQRQRRQHRPRDRAANGHPGLAYRHDEVADPRGRPLGEHDGAGRRRRAISAADQHGADERGPRVGNGAHHAAGAGQQQADLAYPQCAVARHERSAHRGSDGRQPVDDGGHDADRGGDQTRSAERDRHQHADRIDHHRDEGLDRERQAQRAERNAARFRVRHAAVPVKPPAAQGNLRRIFKTFLF
jgi:hypothetical protein